MNGSHIGHIILVFLTVISATQIDLSWNEVPEADGYKIFRDEVQVADVQEPTWSETGLAPSTEYCYRVVAYAASAPETLESDMVCATTWAVTSSPSAEAVPVRQDDPPTLQWEKRFNTGGYDSGLVVRQVDDGGYIILGVVVEDPIGRSRPAETWLIRTDDRGEVKWDKRYPAAVGAFVEGTSEGGFVVVGVAVPRARDDGRGAAWLLKVGPQGNTEWEKFFGGPERYGAPGKATGSMVRQTPDGGFVFVGEVQPPPREGPYPDAGDIWLVKVDARGIMEWDRSFTGPSRDMGVAVEVTTDGGFIVIGDRTPGNAPEWSDEHGDIWLIKTDSQGRMQWERFFSGGSWDWAGSVARSQDGGYAVVGRKGTPGIELYHLWLIKTDSAGRVELDETFDRVPHWGQPSVSATDDGGYVIAASHWDYARSRLWLLKTDPLGQIQWSELFGDDSAHGAAEQTSDGGYIVVGTDQAGEGGGVVWLLKLAPSAGSSAPPVGATGDTHWMWLLVGIAVALGGLSVAALVLVRWGRSRR